MGAPQEGVSPQESAHAAGGKRAVITGGASGLGAAAAGPALGEDMGCETRWLCRMDAALGLSAEAVHDSATGGMPIHVLDEPHETVHSFCR
jgi:NAD(P)-dependent dehydrogenase (short-subunit alcohol dehydrogenase family)